MKTLLTVLLITFTLASNAQESKYYDMINKISKLIGKEQSEKTKVIGYKSHIGVSDFGGHKIYMLNNSTTITIMIKNQLIDGFMLSIENDRERINGYSKALERFKLISNDEFGMRFFDAETNNYIDAFKTTGKEQLNLMFVPL